ncbi:MAG: hypothetical protein R3E48_23275 [Burkholderiaceae bacterium]
MFYNRGVYNSMLVAEAIRTAQKIMAKAVKGEDAAAWSSSHRCGAGLANSWKASPAR